MSFQTKYDRFLMEKYTPTSEEKLGMDLFFTHPDPFAGLAGIRGGNCGDCHLQQTLTGRPNGFESFHNTGLAVPGGNEIGLQKVTGLAADFGKFKTPSLRNIALTAPYMHNGRFATLEDVLDHYNSEELFSKPNVDILIQKGTNQKFGQSLMLTEPEKKAIIAFLHMLTDSTYIQ
jgi:cytochrome c peroxidase